MKIIDIDETLLKMGKTLDFMKQVTSEIKTNQTLILQVQNINEDTNNFIENEIKKRVKIFPNIINDMQEQLDYLKREAKDLQNKVNAKEIENAQLIPNRFLDRPNSFVETIFSTPKYYFRLNFDESKNIIGTQRYQVGKTTLFIETIVTPVSPFTEFDKKVFLALLYLFKNYINGKSQIKYKELFPNDSPYRRPHPSRTCSPDIETSTQEIVNLLDLEIDEDIHNKIAKSISKIRDTTIKFYDKNDEVCKLDLIKTGYVGVHNHNPNESIRVMMERRVYDTLMDSFI
ncbi:hypothetical protein [Campylobacter sp. RM12651]|uniref:hypothetical protein n=1 Tax=Campylobacter sp. RM12651 TaxID=1660079 RepID=UPI001EFBCCD3|nr:hypothetical protein [Campylobacter sp. RM12651]ULO04543.1 hypothetical protein AVBRAN_a0061 [Campylobacter sp. RM12651]